MDATHRRRILRRLGAPAAPPPVINTIVAEGDSITAAYNMITEFVAAYPGVTVYNQGVSSSTIGTSADAPGANSLWGRIATTISRAPDLVSVMIGSNDLGYDTSGAVTFGKLTDYLTALRAALPDVVLAVATVVPRNDAVNHNPRRPAMNASIWGALGGGLIDVVIPMGDHPVYSSDAAGANVALWPDGIHPGVTVQAALARIYRVTLGPRMPAPNESTAIPRADLNNAAPGSVNYEYTTVAGLPFRTSTGATVTGTGDISVGLEASYGTGKTVTNGQVITSRLTASATPSAALDHTLAFNGVSDTWTVTSSSGAALVADYRTGGTGDAGNTASFDFTGITTYAGEKHVVMIAAGNFTGTPVLTLGGDAMTKLAGEVISGTQVMFAFEVVPTAPGAGKTLTFAATNIGFAGFDMWTTDAAATYASAASRGFDYLLDPQQTSTDLTVPASGVGLIQVRSGGTSATPGAGCTEDAERALGGERMWAGQRADTGRGAANCGDYTGSQILAVAYRP